MKFYLGTHMPHWLALTDMPLFVSRRTLGRYRTLPRAITDWVCDSGGFTELSMHGAWQTTEAQYVAEVRRFATEVGRMEYAAIQDYMCEPFVLAKTGLSLQEHQRRTVRSFLSLRERAPEIPWLPVLQGWQEADYLRCMELYERAGVDLRRQPLVGVGSVCRRQATAEAVWIFRTLAGMGLRLHGFGVKLGGLAQAASVLTSADSMAWSYDARRNSPLPDCAHKNCANCLKYAVKWYLRVVSHIEACWYQPYQLRLAV